VQVEVILQAAQQELVEVEQLVLLARSTLAVVEVEVLVVIQAEQVAQV